MRRVYNERFPSDLILEGYKNNTEYLQDNIKRVKMMLEYYKICLNNDTLEQSSHEARDEYLLAKFYIEYRLKNTEDASCIWAKTLKDKFHLNDLEWTCLLISMIFYEDPVYRKILLDINAQKDKTSVEYETVLKIYFFTDSVSKIDDFYDKLLNLKFKMSELCFKRNSMEIDSNIYSVLTCGESKTSISGVETHFVQNKSDENLPIREKIAEKIYKISQLDDMEKQFCFCLRGATGIGKKTLAKRAAELMSKGLVVIDLNLFAVLNNETFYNLIYTPLREAILTNSAICLQHFEVFNELNPQKYEYLDFLLLNIYKFSKDIFILSDNTSIKVKENSKFSTIYINLEELDQKENYIVWKHYIDKEKEILNISARDISNKFKFNPGQIKSTMDMAKSLWYWKGCKPLNDRDLYKCAYSQSISKLSGKSTLIKAAYTWKDLILDDNEKDMIKNACDQIKYRHIVYDEWGMNSRVKYGRGLSMLFAGPPGTGKTMAAQVVASELGLEIYKADLSQVVSKYIGETEKNLNDLFDEAKKSNVILFFDEMDAIFGKRTEVKDSHDKNSNVETSYLLQKMEEYEGITIMTTNYLENIDKAFFRRISYVIHFAFPNAETREKIWISMFPQKTPISKNIDFKYLAQNFEISGGNIKNIAINAAFMAARDTKEVQMKHILKSTIYELKKQGKNLLKEDLGEYAYML